MGGVISDPLDLAIVIVNYNTCALLRDCLQSVYAGQGRLSMAVCMVDNASPDDSVAMVRAEFPQVHVIANGDNAGYPQANNQGLRLFGFRAPLTRRTDRRTDRRTVCQRQGCLATPCC